MEASFYSGNRRVFMEHMKERKLCLRLRQRLREPGGVQAGMEALSAGEISGGFLKRRDHPQIGRR